MTKFYKCIAAPASGKSYGSIRYMVRQIQEESKRYVLAAISVELCKDLKSNIYSANPNIKVDILIQENTPTSSRVQDRYEEYLKESDADILIITHATLLNFKGRVSAEGWSMVVDELPNIVEMKAIKGTLANDNISQWLEYKHPDKEAGYREMIIKVGWEATLEKEISASEDIAHEEGFVATAALSGLQGILSGDTSILRSEYEDSDGLTKVVYYFSHIHDPLQLWAGFEEVVFLCAEFNQQLTGIVFKHKFHITVEDKPEIELRSTSYEKPERIKIYPLLLPPTTFTKRTSRSYYDTKTNKKFPVKISENLTEIFQHLVDVAEDIVGDKGYIYTVNKFRNEQIEQGDFSFLSERDKVERLKYNPHGLNRFMVHNIALGLFHCNPSPYQRTLLKHIALSCEVEPEVFYKGYETTAYLDPIFQLVTRTAIRNFEDIQDIICIVPDHRVAKYLTDGWFKGAIVDYQYAVSIKDGRKTNARPNKFQGMFDMSSAEKSSYTRWVKSVGMKPKEMNTQNNDHVALVTDWIENKRGDKA
tara:strand:- start:4581 stop:6179 length:1599 start_codon:yes stop_codon:yes gene_type:complete